VEFRLEWRGPFENLALNRLHAEAFGHAIVDDDWVAQVESHSLGWICAWSEAEEFIGFVNVAWDGGIHAFVLDVIVSADSRRSGLGAARVQLAITKAREARCEWLHVDFEDDLRPFYFDHCGFTSTTAGLINLKTGRRSDTN